MKKSNNNLANASVTSVTTNVKSQNGGNIESIDSVKYFSPLLYSSQNRAVTARDYEKKLSNNLSGKELISLWKDEFSRVADAFSKADPKKRVKWAGPDMSVRSSITARHMETWSHGQEVFDQLGIDRINTDRIKNIVIIGINTFGWTFINRSLEVPKKVPMIILVSPSNRK